MNRVIVSLFLFCAISFFAPLPATAVTINTVPVGNVGNGNDPATGNLYGGVGYGYNIGTTEVTVGQYTAFLNAVAATDTYALYSTSMATNLNIAVNSAAPSSSTAAPPSPLTLPTKRAPFPALSLPSGSK